MRVYNLKLDKKFKGGQKEWEAFNHSALQLLMNEHLTLISDTVLCLHDRIQMSLETVEKVGDDEVDFRTPTKRKRGAAADLAALQSDEVSDDSEMSDPGENETADARKERKKSSAAKVRRNAARQIRREASKPLPLKPLCALRPAMLIDPAFEIEWIAACDKAMGGDILERMEIMKTDILMDYNNKYYDETVMRVKTPEELVRRHDHIVADVLRTINRQIVTMFYTCCVREKDATKEQDALRSILCTAEMKEVMLGRRCDLAWLLKPWLMPCVRVYVQLMHYYESLTDTTNVNLITEMSNVLVETKTESVYRAREDFDKVLDPMVKNFTSVETLIQFLKDCFAAHVIRQRGADTGAAGRAWRKASDHLRDCCKDGTRLDKEMVEEAMQLAAAHLRDKPTGESVKSHAIKAPATADPLTPKAAATKLKKTLKAKEKKIKALEARLSDPAGAAGGKPSVTPRQPGQTPHKSALCEGRGDAPLCTIPDCKQRHFGRCPGKRNFSLEKKQLEADEARWKRTQGQEAEKKDRAAANVARDVGGWETVESNESDSECFRVSIFDPSEPTPDHIRVSVHNTFLTKKRRRASACVDSGSMVTLSGDKEHVIELLEGEVQVTGAHGGSAPATPAVLGLRTVSSTGTPLLLEVPGRAYYMEGVNDTILALAPIKKAGHRVKLKTGTEFNPEDGGYIKLTSGERIDLVFENDLWRLPLFAAPKHTCARATAPRHRRDTVTQNPYAMLADIDLGEETESDEEAQQDGAQQTQGV
jgi:hypothetical protein